MVNLAHEPRVVRRAEPASELLAPLLAGLGLADDLADTLALVLLTLLIAYLSLVLGELVPKRIALQRAAGMALLVGPPLDRFATLMRPVVWFLSVSTNAVVRLLGGDPDATSEDMTDEELRYLVDQHQGLGDSERAILVDVFDAGDRSLREVMRPRADVVTLPGDSSVAEVIELVRTSPYSRYPVVGDGTDDVLGFLHVRDLLDATPDALVSDLARPITFLPATNRVLPTLGAMRRERTHIAIVVDEYGGTYGIVTLEDLVEELIGEIEDEYDPPPAVETGGIAAGLSIEEFAEATGVELEDGPYETAAGFVLHRLGRIAAVGDRVRVDDEHTLLVTEVDGHRITRLDLRATPTAAPPEPA